MTEQPKPVRPMLTPERIEDESGQSAWEFLVVALTIAVAGIATFALLNHVRPRTITQSCDRAHYGIAWQEGRVCTETLTWDGDGYVLTGIQWRDK